MTRKDVEVPELTLVNETDPVRRAFVVGAFAVAGGAPLLGANTAQAVTSQAATSNLGSAKMMHDPEPNPWRTVRVYAGKDVLFNLEKMNAVTRNVLGVLGCPTCHSGFVLQFQEMIDYVVNPATLGVRPLGGAPAE